MSEVPDDPGFDVDPSVGTPNVPYEPPPPPPPATMNPTPPPEPSETVLLPTWPVQVPVHVQPGTAVPDDQPDAGEFRGSEPVVEPPTIEGE